MQLQENGYFWVTVQISPEYPLQYDYQWLGGRKYVGRESKMR